MVVSRAKMNAISVKTIAMQVVASGSAMKNKSCTYPWRAMWGDQLPPECFVRLPLVDGLPDCEWCACGGGGCLRRGRK